MADYHNLIYYKDAAGLYVNLYAPSEVKWGGISVVQQTTYPEADTASLTISGSGKFALYLRVPAWSREMSIVVNGAPSGVPCKPGEWATLDRTWTSGDRIEVRIPLRLRYEAVDRWHPRRVAVMRGPVVLALDYNYHAPWFELPRDEADLGKWLAADDSPAVFRVNRPDGRPVRLKFRPFYQTPEDFPYLMYFDLDKAPYALW
jgi:DUF1680 family protein